jgi:hypothetical protein
MQWIVDNATSKNIIAVIGLGDNVTVPNDTNFALAKQGWDLISNAGIPFITSIGAYHEYDNQDTQSRSAVLFNQYFGTSYFTGKSFYGGCLNNSTENYYIHITSGGISYLILSLECFPRNESLTWAQSIISANPDCKVIITTHGYLNGDGTRTLHADKYGPDSYGLTADNDGQQIWDKLIKVNPNILMVVCGHQLSTTSAVRIDSSVYGNQVNQVFINHQLEGKYSGKDRIGLLTLQPTAGIIDMKTFSPYLSAYDPTGAYTLKFDNAVNQSKSINK